VGMPSGGRPPYWAVRELLNWAADRWAEIEKPWIYSGADSGLLDLPLRRLIVVLYATLVDGLPPEARQRVDNILGRSPDTRVADMPDIPIPSDWALDDIPPDMLNDMLSGP
jgi:hypothetical protein